MSELWQQLYEFQFSFEILIALTSAIIGFVGLSINVYIAIHRKFSYSTFKNSDNLSYTERLRQLVNKIESTSSGMDELFAEASSVAKERERAIQGLEAKLADLETQERETRQRMQALEKTPPEAAEIFAQMLAPQSKRSARRDYLLFFIGVVVTTLIGIVVQIIL